MKTIFFILMFLPSTVFAGENWDAVDKSLFGTYLIFNAADISQTIDICGNYGVNMEYNPIVKWEYNRFGKAGLYGDLIISTIGAYLIADWLTPKKRKVFLTIISYVEVSAVKHNYYAGMKFRF
jgi:hypothetical protein